MRPSHHSGLTSHTVRRAVVGMGMIVGLMAAAAAQSASPVSALYEEHEVTFASGDVTLAGTLTVPAGTPTEYATLEKVFVPGLLDDVSAWILRQAKR